MDTAELKLVSPLLDGMTVLECLNSAGGFTCYLLERTETKEKFVLKHISIPESDAGVEAMILSGALHDREEAKAYYRDVAQAQAIEVRNWQKLSGLENLSLFTGFQLVEREEGAIGYDFYLLAPYRTSLHAYLQSNAMTHLQALNLGIDLCNALAGIRQAGYIHQDLKPENIFVDENGRFSIGDLGLAPLEDLTVAALPEHYSSCYSAPELADIMANLNDTVDLYSVGMILYHLFNGSHAPFEEDGKPMQEADALRLQGKALPAPQYADYELAEILCKACAFRPADRFDSPNALRQALMVYMQKNAISDELIVSPIDIGETIDPEDPGDSATEELPEKTAEPAAAESEESEEAPAEPEAAPAELAAPEEDAAGSEKPAEAPAEPNDAPDAAAEEAAPAPAAPPAAEQTVDTPDAAPETDETAALDAAALAAAPEAVPTEAEASETTAESNAEPEPATEPATEAAPAPADETKAPEKAPDEMPGTPAAEPTPDTPKKKRRARRTRKAPAPKTQDETPPITAESSLDDILADANRILDGEPTQERASAARPKAEKAEDPEAILPRRRKKKQSTPYDGEEAPGKKRRTGLRVCITLLVLAILAAGAWFGYTHWYHVVLSNLKTETGGDYIAVTFTSSIKDAPLAATCKDSYGNAYTGQMNGSTVIFRDLAPGTLYYVTFSVEKPRALAGETEINVTTNEAVQVDSFTAAAGTVSTSVNLNVAVTGQAPASWTVEYADVSGQTKQVTFEGHSTTVQGLTLGHTYTFTLVPPSGSSIVGQTSVTYEAAARIQAAGLHVAAMTDDSVTVAWLSLGDAPASWHIAAAGPDYAQETDVTDATATFTGVRRDAAYTFTLTADGLDAPITLELPANAPTVTSFTAAASGAGAIQAQWAYDGEMADGWQVEYTASGSDALLSTAKTAQQVVTLQQVAPNCSYIVRLLGPDGGALIGPTVTQVQTPAAENYTGHGFTAGSAQLETYLAVSSATFTLQDLGEAQTEFVLGDALCLALHAPEGFDSTDTAPATEGDAGDADGDTPAAPAETLITVVLRDQSGQVADLIPASGLWSTLWQDGVYLLALPRSPSAAGGYQLEVYFDSQLAAQCDFTVLQKG